MDHIPARGRRGPYDHQESASREGRDGDPADRGGHRLLSSRSLQARRAPSPTAPRSETRRSRSRLRFRHHLDFLKNEVLPRSTDDWRIGPDLFARKLDLELDAGLSAAEVLAEAEREAARVETEMAVIARQYWAVGLPRQARAASTIPQGRRELIKQVLDAVADDHGTPATLVADVRGTVADIKTFITANRILPLIEPDRCRIIEMPEFLRGNSVAYLNPAPPLDVKGSSEYAVSPPPADWTPQQVESYLREYNRAMLKILTIHEGYPAITFSSSTATAARR